MLPQARFRECEAAAKFPATRFQSRNIVNKRHARWNARARRELTTQVRDSKATTPPPSAAPLLKRGGETRPPRPLRGHPSSREEGKLDHPARCAGTPPQERRGKQCRRDRLPRPNQERPSAA